MGTCNQLERLMSAKALLQTSLWAANQEIEALNAEAELQEVEIVKLKREITGHCARGDAYQKENRKLKDELKAQPYWVKLQEGEIVNLKERNNKLKEQAKGLKEKAQWAMKILGGIAK